MNMAEAKDTLKAMANGDYHRLSYSLLEHSNGDLAHECGVYINGYNWHLANTFDEALALLRAEMQGVSPTTTITENLADLPLAVSE